MSPLRLARSLSFVLLVDIQERLLPAMQDPQGLSQRAGVLLEAAEKLEVPLALTEQYPQGLGRTIPALTAHRQRAERESVVDEKTRFTAWTPRVREAVEASARETIVLCGIETHVCVLQTALDLIEAGRPVAVACDAVGSRRKADHEAGLRRLEQSGAVLTTVESVILEWVEDAGAPAFKAVLPLIK